MFIISNVFFDCLSGRSGVAFQRVIRFPALNGSNLMKKIIFMSCPSPPFQMSLFSSIILIMTF